MAFASYSSLPYNNVSDENIDQTVRNERPNIDRVYRFILPSKAQCHTDTMTLRTVCTQSSPENRVFISEFLL